MCPTAQIYAVISLLCAYISMQFLILGKSTTGRERIEISPATEYSSQLYKQLCLFLCSWWESRLYNWFCVISLQNSFCIVCLWCSILFAIFLLRCGLDFLPWLLNFFMFGKSNILSFFMFQLTQSFVLYDFPFLYSRLIINMIVNDFFLYFFICTQRWKSLIWNLFYVKWRFLMAG